MPVKKTTKKKEVQEEIVQQPQMSLMKEKFLEILKQMFYDERSIGHLLFNGIFRVPANKCLYEVTDDEIIKAFEAQLDIMSRGHEKGISEDKKREKARQVLK